MATNHQAVTETFGDNQGKNGSGKVHGFILGRNPY
jgi:hypothetical protein